VSFYGLVDGSDASLKSYLNNLSGVDQVGAEARAAMLATRSIKTSSKRWAIERDSKAAQVVLDQLRPPLKELLS